VALGATLAIPTAQSTLEFGALEAAAARGLTVLGEAAPPVAIAGAGALGVTVGVISILPSSRFFARADLSKPQFIPPVSLGDFSVGSATPADLALVAPLLQNAKSTTAFPFVVRLQAQGGGLEQSIPLANTRPITAAEGIAGLAILGSQLSKKQLVERAVPFARASRFILNAAAGGGVGPPGKSFALPGPAGIRVDVEVRSGVNFTR
jgi:hypothetical protein